MHTNTLEKIFSACGPAGIPLLAAAACLFLLTACDPPPEKASAPPVPAVTEDSADLVIALLPERNVFEQKQKYLPLREYLTRRMEMSVYFKLLDNYEHIFSEILDNRIDGGFWGSMNGAIAQLRGGIVMIARPVWPDGTSTYFGYIYTRRGSGITADPLTWKGRSMAFVNKATTAGFLFPMSLLRNAGITEDPADFFSNAVFSGSHDASILAVYQGEVDMGASKNTIFREYLNNNPEIDESLEVVAESAQVPSNGLGVRPGLSESIRRKLGEALLTMHESEEGRQVLERFGAVRFIETSIEDYRPVIDMAAQANIDLSKWPLRDVRGARPYR